MSNDNVYKLAEQLVPSMQQRHISVQSLAKEMSSNPWIQEPEHNYVEVTLSFNDGRCITEINGIITTIQYDEIMASYKASIAELMEE